MNFEELLAKGGPVVWVLLGYSVLALTVILERLVYLLALGRPHPELAEAIERDPGGESMRAILARSRGPEGALLSGMLAAFDAGVRDLARVASRLGSARLQAMERGFRTLAILGNTAPLLGLFGTITGMIKAFMVIEQAGGRVDAQALAGGIWEAMITTGVGLVVAIPILLMLHLLEGMADRRAQSMRAYASLLIERLPHTAAPDEEEPVHHREGTVHAL